MAKRYRLPEPKGGVLDVRWGRAESFAKPSLCYTYPNREIKADTRVVMEALERERYEVTLSGVKTLPSLVQELEARGYDITTLRFSIKKKGTT